MEARPDSLREGPEQSRQELAAEVERLRAELARRQEEAQLCERRFDLITQHAGDIICLFDQDLRYRYVSPAAERILGHKPEDILGKTVFDVAAPEHHEEIRRRAALRMEHHGKAEAPTELDEPMALKIRDASGATRWFEVKSSVMTDALGRPTGMVSVVRDIEERVRAEAALRESEGRYRALFDRAGVFYSVYDACGTCLLINERTAAAFGARPEDIVGKTFRDLHVDNWREYTRRVAHSIKTGEVVEYEDLVSFPGGARWLISTVYPAPSPTGETLAAQIVSMDITARKKAQAALHESRERLQAILDHSPTFIVVKDAQGRYRLANKRFYELFGKTRDEVIGRTAFDLVPAEDARRLTASEREVIETGQPRTVEFNSIYQGNRRWFMVNVFPLPDDQGRLVQLGLVGAEVTEQKRLEAENLRRGQLATLGELAAGVAHEINNPINGIINYAQVMLDRGALSPEDLDIDRRIIREGERIAGIVQNLLMFAREQRQEWRTIAVREPLHHALHLMGGLLEGDRISLALSESLEGKDDLPPVRARGRELQQVFINIISNARHALNERFPKADLRKGLEVSARVEAAAEGDAGDGGDRVGLTFRDHGRGMDPEVLRQVMNPFYTTKAEGEGTGLGLSIAEGIVREHGGELAIESLPDRGTWVTVWLPAARDEA